MPILMFPSFLLVRRTVGGHAFACAEDRIRWVIIGLSDFDHGTAEMADSSPEVRIPRYEGVLAECRAVHAKLFT
ncbi:hypothetical protein [Streptomyces sp. NPDC127039]|uniref:hypothetical protein n=1 Tax=Streptomyces sp. NPDC127039 TaxID=3347115 RepID=UPI003663ED21